MLRNGIFRSIRKRLLGKKGEERFDDLLEHMALEVESFYTAEINELAIKPKLSNPEGVFDIADICAAALCDDEGNIEATDEAFDTFCEQILTRGGGDLTLFERCDDTIEREVSTSPSLNLDKSEDLSGAGDQVDLAETTRVILLEYREPTVNQPVGYDLFTSGTQDFSVMHPTLPSDCISL